MLAGTAIATVAAAGGTAIVQAVPTDGWQAFTTRIATLMGRAGPVVEADTRTALDRTKAELDALDGEVLDRTRGVEQLHWTNALLVFLREYPEAADELASLLEA